MKVHFRTNVMEYFIDTVSVLIRLESHNKYHISVTDYVHRYTFYLDETNKVRLAGCLASGTVLPIEASEK